MSAVPSASATGFAGLLSPTAARKAMIAVAVLFLVKAAALALFVTPLWDVPDESGHLGYVLDLADGRGLPVYGSTPLPAEVLARWDAEGAALPPFNWVAQHPPLYHALAAPFALAARAVTSDPEAPLRAPRLLSVLAATIALWILFEVLFAATGDSVFALAGAGSVAFVPMYTHLASGTHHETLLALAGGLAALGWVRFVRTGAPAHALATAAGLGFAGAIKLTAIPVAVALLVLTPRYLAGPRGWRRMGHWLLLAGIALGPPGAWLLRNALTTGHAFVYAAPEPFHPGRLLRLIAREPVFDHTFKNLVGLIGWMGSGELRWFQISGLFLAAYLGVALLVGASAAAWSWRDVGRPRPAPRAVLRGLFAAVFAAALMPALSERLAGFGVLKQAVYALLAAVPFFGLALFFERPGANARREIIRSSQWVVLVFAGAYFWNVWRGWAIYGQMRAVHGRYFFAILPFLLLGLAYPGALFWRPGRTRDAFLVALLPLLAANEAAFFLTRVIPFYQRAG